MVCSSSEIQLERAFALEQAKQTNEKLPFWRKLGYGVGDIYGGGSTVAISFYYLVFLVDIVRLNPQLAGFVILFSKIYDSITDPLEGVLVDRTRTPIGRRRPYFIIGVPLIFITFYLLFNPVTFGTQAGRFAYVIFAYVLFSTTLSLVMVNYNALQSEMTPDYNERATLGAFRLVFSATGAVLAGGLPLQLTALSADAFMGWRLMGLVLGAIFAIPFIFVAIAGKENPDFQMIEPEPFSFRQAFVEPFQMKSFVYLVILYILPFIALDAMSGSIVFFVKNYLGQGENTTSILSVVILGSQLVALPLFTRLSRMTGKHRTYLIGGAVWVVSMFGTLLVSPDSSPLLLYGVAVIVGSGIGGVVVSLLGMYPDIPDVDELQSGQRREGMYSSFLTLSRKFSSAFALFLVAQFIGITGYIPPEEVVVDGVTMLIEQQQTPTFILSLRLLFAFLPLAFVGPALFIALRYPLTERIHERLRNVLSVRRSGGEEDEAFKAEVEDLRQTLV